MAEAKTGRLFGYHYFRITTKNEVEQRKQYYQARVQNLKEMLEKTYSEPNNNPKESPQ